MNTLTNCAEKKAKQFFNLLQRYTKGIRITAILILLLMGVNNAWAVDFSGGEILVLKPNSNWTKDGARFAAYFFGNGDKWISMSAVTINGTSGYYQVTAPSGYKNVIFCRMNGSAAANNWNNKWNQTGDLTYDGTKNVFTVPSGDWDGSTSGWGNITITVTLNAQSGTGGTASVDVNYGEDERPTVTAPTRTGYTFGGFYTSTGGGGSQVINASNAWQKNISNYVDANGRWIKDAACTLYAKWTEKTYSLTFKHDGNGTIKVGGTAVNSGNTATVNYHTTKALVATPNIGYNFSKWTLSGSNTSAVTIGSTSTASTTIKATNTGATVTANFTPKTYNITLDANGGASNGSATATYNSNTVKNATYPTRTDYRCNGYFTAATDGTLVLNTDGTLAKNVSGYTDANGNWIKDGDATLYAQWTYDVTEYTVTFGVGTGSTSYGSLTAYNNTTSTSITSPATVRSQHSVTFTAKPNTGYIVEGWYTDAACTAGKHDAGSTAYTTSIIGETNVYVKFIEKTWSVAFTAGTGGTVTTPSSTPQTVGQVTGINIVANPSTGYSFANWTSSNGGSFGSTTNASTTFKPTAATTVTANFSEIKHTVQVGIAAGQESWGSVSPNSVSVGQHTASGDIKATAQTSVGYVFDHWEISDGITITSGDENSATIQIKATKDGSLTAHFRGENRMQDVYLIGTMNDWKESDAEWRFYKLPGESGNTVTLTKTINKSDFHNDGYKFGINIYHSDWGDKWWKNSSSNDTKMDAHSCTGWGFNTKDGDKRTYIDLNVSGEYTFTLTNANSSSQQKLSITYPDKSFIEGDFATAWDEDAYPLTENGDIQTVTIPITSKTDIPFRLVSHGKLFGTGTKILIGSNSQTLSAKNMEDGGAVMTIGAYVEGDYVFSYNKSTKDLTVTYPSVSQLQIYSATPAHDAVKKYWDWDSQNGNVYTKTLSLNANTTYTFKAVVNSDFYGKNDTKLTRKNQSVTLNTDGGDVTITTDVAGDYTFTFNSSNKNLSVTYPEAYAVTYGVGNNKGTDKVTTTPSIISGNLVLASTEITFSKGATNAGYTWKNWNSKADGTGTILETGDTYVSSNRATDITVYACYDLITYNITYNLNGGTGATNTTYNVTTATITLPTPSKIGYTFSGWYDNEGCTEEPITTIPQGSTGHKTYYAKWTANTYTVEFNANGGSGSMSDQSFTYDEASKALTDNAFTRTGYTFVGWNTKDDGTGTSYTNEQEVQNLTADNNGTITLYAQWTINNYNINYTPPTHGTFTIQVGSNTPVSANTTADYNTTITLANNPAPGYHFGSWDITPNDVSITNNNTFSMPASNVTIGVTFAANTYKVKFDANGGTGTMSDLPFTYDIAQNLTANVFERTGYNFSGWNTNADGTGTTYTDGKSVQNLTAENEGTVTLYAQWTANTYTVTLQHSTIAGYGSGGTSSVTATYDAAMPAVTMPTAANGYVFMGYFDGEQGAGTQYYNADGTSAHVWNKAKNATLYAHFVKAEITQITLDKYTFEPVEAGGTGFVTATPTIEPTPTNDVILCWRLLYNNGNPVAGRDAQVVSGNSVQFSIAGLAAGTYKIEAVLRAGNNCGSGEVLSTKMINFSIASTYTITVKYTCDGKEIMAASKVPAHVSEETEITAPNITGYTFSSWEAGDGVTIKSTNNDKVKITAIYDGYLTAKYTARPMVYFKNTLGWEKVYVYTFTDNAWWNDNGTGVHPATNKLEQGEMTRIGETDIYYFALTTPDGDYTQNNNANPNYIAFSNVDYRNDNGAFRSGQAIYRGDHKERLTLFVPQKDQTPETHNSTKYYSKGIWMEYNSTESGYQLAGEVPNDDPEHDGWGTWGNKFTAQQLGNYIFTITKHLEANTTYKFKIKNAVWIKDYSNKDNNQWFGYEGTISNSTTNWLHFKGDNDEGKNNGDAKITTTATGEYTFTIDLSQGKVLLSVEYPIEVGDYRVIYKDNATWSKGTAHDVNWYHPSRIIKKNKTAEPTKDIISFFISYGQNTTMQFQRVKSITNGKVTWENVREARIPDDVKEAGVYNFIVTQTANGASISMEDSAEPYTGNYYIRVDALAGKWDNYKTNPENRMTYSAFSESEANSFGEKFSHYATKYCTNGTNIKFTIANDYSPCISDTLVQDVVNPLGNLDSEGTLLNNDMYSANVRFMWNRKTNKISRAYVGPAAEKQSQFLMLRTKDEIQGEAENETLNTSEGDILDAGNSIYAARFADTQNWMYERTVRVKPGTRVKLYASYPKCYHIYVENNTGWSEIALYAWKDNGDQPLGEWPGLRPARTVEIGGKTYHDFQVNEWVFGSKLKLNNNNNGSETNEFNGIRTAGNYYLKKANSDLTTVKYEANVTEANAQYFRGAYDDNNATWDDDNSVVILGGDGDNWNKIRVIYDFKTNRLMAALVPEQEVSGPKTIAADVMIIRQHQNPATSITLANDASKMTQVKTVYGSLQLNRWVLNNRKSDKSGIEFCTEKIDNQDTYSENVTNTHHPVLPTGEQKSIYERALYFISFPFDVHLSDVFGFGTYGTHWVISDYNGLRRAQRGYFAEDCINEDCTNWDYIWDPADFVLEANKGYLLSLDLDLMRYDNTDFWLHNIDQVELFFPSTANLATIEKTSYAMPALSEEYLCKINHNTDGTTPDRDRRVKDSYWRCIGVPSFANYDGSLYKSKEDAEANEGEEKYPINWKDDYKWTAEESGFPFLYEWNVTDNSLSVQNTSAYQFKPTFAYLVQNGDAIYWKAVNAKSPTPIIARQRTEADRNYEWKIALLRNGNQEDQTFVRITDNENVTTAFDFNQDLAKEFNYGRGDIYTLIGYERVAANSMPCSDKTTIIPLGLNIEQAGDYTIVMPEGVENIGITLVDNETGIHTNLSAGQEYTLTLNNGICENRLFIEVSPIQNTPTDLEYTTEDTREQTTRKMLIDGILYLIRDGVIYDAQGHKL